MTLRNAGASWGRGRFSGAFEVLGKIRFHPLFIVLVVLATGVGLWKDVIVLFLLVMLHEIGHAAAAQHLGYQVQEVSLLPFGGVAKLSYGKVGFTPKHEALIAIAGPLVNFVLAGVAWLLYGVGIWSESFCHLIIQLNLWIAGFNLLPGLPLDGGRVLRAARARTMGYEGATREAYNVAFVISVVLFVFGGLSLWAGFPHFGVLVLGIFLFVSAWTGRRDLSMEIVRFLDAKRGQDHRETAVVRSLAAPATASIRDVVRQFSPDRYHMVYVLNQQGSVQTIVEEEELLEAVFEGRWMDSLEDWILRDV